MPAEDRTRALSLGALNLVLANEVAKGLELGEKAVEISPRYGRALGITAYALNALQRPDEAIGIAERAIEADPEFSLGYIALASAFLIKGEPARAAPFLADAVLQFPQDLTLLSQAAVAHVRIGAYDQAERYIAAVESLKPGDTVMADLRAQIAAAGERPPARQSQSPPSNNRAAATPGAFERCQTEAAKAEPSQAAVDACAEASEDRSLDSRDRLVATRGYADALIGIERAASAAFVAEQGLREWPDDVVLLYILAFTGFEIGSTEALERSLAAATKLMELRPDDGNHAATAAGILFQLGRLDEAQRALDRAVRTGANADFASRVQGDIRQAKAARGDGESAPSPSGDLAVDPLDVPYVVITNANVRTGPNVGAARVTTLPKGTEVTVLGKVRGADWYLIARDGDRLGYVFGPLIAPSGSDAAIAAGAPATPPSTRPNGLEAYANLDPATKETCRVEAAKLPIDLAAVAGACPGLDREAVANVVFAWQLVTISTKLERFDREGAEQHVEAIVALFPEEPLTWINKGELELERGDYEATLQAFAKARQLGLADPIYYWQGEAIAHIFLLRPDTALSITEDFAASEPLIGFSHALLATARLLRDDPSGASRALDEMQRSTVVPAEAWGFAAVVYNALGMFAESLDSTKRAEAMRPTVLSPDGPPPFHLFRVARDASNARHRLDLTEVIEAVALAAKEGGPVPALVPSPAVIENRDAVAVIIGNRAYGGDVPEVSYAHNDADAMKRYVVEVLGFRDGNIIDLRDATLADLNRVSGTERNPRAQLANWIRDGRSDVFVFYSGHGVPGLGDKRGYLLPSDGVPDLAEVTGYPLDILQQNLAKLDARSVRVFIDACFSGNSAGGMLLRAASGIGISAPLSEQAGGRFAMITAASGDQIASWDHNAEQGLFTAHILAALNGAADGERWGDGDGQVTLAELRAYLDDEMTFQARRRFNREQRASFVGQPETVLAGK